MNIYYSIYELVPVSSLNARVKKVPRRGALLRVEFGDGFEGFANLHPNPERLGTTLEEELRWLAEGHPSLQTGLSLRLASMDAKARRDKKSLWDHVTIPECHYLVTEPIGFSAVLLSKALEDGFQKFKIKVGRDLPEEIKILERMSRELPPKSLRPDFNQSLDGGSLRLFCETLSPTLRESFDFVEDPTAAMPEVWSLCSDKIPWALDQGSEKVQRTSKGFTTVILKPAIQDCEALWPMLDWLHCRVVFTSYMDHPVGQLGAAFIAAQFYKEHPSLKEICGLMSQNIFEPTPYSECLKTKGPHLFPPAGEGIGFGDLLAKEHWEKLYQTDFIRRTNFY